MRSENHVEIEMPALATTKRSARKIAANDDHSSHFGIVI
ncbi:hypothetical protein BMF35_a1615 [Aurantiacibacter gangjinensis]|nr:hypothetical protein BMF35_a1615 [Aurantiacibacter gangjinensis]